MGLKNLRNLPVKLDPNDHGYGEATRAELGEVVVERDGFDQTDIQVDYDQRPRRARRR